MRAFRFLFLPAALASLAPLRADDAPAKPDPDAALAPSDLARSATLREIVADEQALYAEFARTDALKETALPDAEKERRVKAIGARYDALLREDPDHLETLLLYAKFLRRVGDRDLAFKTFLRADRIAPGLAVVKHQMAAHLAEDGRVAEARPLFLRAIELAPKEAKYRYDYGEFLANADALYAVGGPMSREVRDREMMEAFGEAARLKPAEAGYRWRAAEAWYDVAHPDAKAALAAWTALAAEAKSPEEKEVTGLHRARWLVALDRSAEARPLIRASTSPGLDATRRKLLDEIEKREPGFRDPGKDPTRKTNP